MNFLCVVSGIIPPIREAIKNIKKDKWEKAFWQIVFSLIHVAILAGGIWALLYLSK